MDLSESWVSLDGRVHVLSFICVFPASGTNHCREKCSVNGSLGNGWSPQAPEFQRAQERTGCVSFILPFFFAVRFILVKADRCSVATQVDAWMNQKSNGQAVRNLLAKMGWNHSRLCEAAAKFKPSPIVDLTTLCGSQEWRRPSHTAHNAAVCFSWWLICFSLSS